MTRGHDLKLSYYVDPLGLYKSFSNNKDENGGNSHPEAVVKAQNTFNFKFLNFYIWWHLVLWMCCYVAIDSCLIFILFFVWSSERFTYDNNNKNIINAINPRIFIFTDNLPKPVHDPIDRNALLGVWLNKPEDVLKLWFASCKSWYILVNGPVLRSTRKLYNKNNLIAILR